MGLICGWNIRNGLVTRNKKAFSLLDDEMNVFFYLQKKKNLLSYMRVLAKIEDSSFREVGSTNV